MIKLELLVNWNYAPLAKQTSCKINQRKSVQSLVQDLEARVTNNCDAPAHPFHNERERVCM